jgi:signal transduction histidine kinase
MTQPCVLLVDDENQFRQVLSKRLSRRGFSIREAADGASALERMNEAACDVVVMDVKMPGMTGIETLAEIRRRHPESEVILLTGHASTEDGVAGIKAGAFDYLTKPVEMEHLAGKIRQALDKIDRAREKRREREFRERMECRMVAAERLASLGTLATGIAHEVNNPLAVINDAAGWLTDLLADAPDDMPLRRQLEMGLGKITTSVARARRITHQLLGHARQSEPEVSRFDLVQLVREAVELVGKPARARSVLLEVDAPEGPLPLRSDPGQLRQVLINLLTNAIHATAEGSEVRVAIRPHGDHADFTVSDQGPGIPEEHMEHIFEPFFSTKPAGVGTGLGLFVTADIVGRLGGTVSAENRAPLPPGEPGGADFIVTLPLEYEPLAEAKEESS